MLSSSKRRVASTHYPSSTGIIQRQVPWALEQHRHIWPLIVGGVVIAAGATLGHYVARALRRVKEREAVEHATGEGDSGNSSASPVFSGDVVSLDMGSSFAKIAYLDDQRKVNVLENREGRHATPCVYQFDTESGLIVGQVAKTQRFMKPDMVASAVHQLVGLPSTDALAKKLLTGVPFKSLDIEGEVGIDLRGNQYSATKLAETVARDMYSVAQGKLGSMDGVTGAISVPLFFNALQRAQYLKACKAAGFSIASSVESLPTDPIAAVSGAIEQGVLTQAGDIAVIDIGGRHTQISIVEVKVDGTHAHVLKAYHTSFDVGSELIDDLIVKKLAADFLKSHKLDILGDGMAVQRLYDAAESSKIELSRTPTSDINLPFITADATGPKHLAQGLSRAQMDALIEDMLAKLALPVNDVVTRSNIAAKTPKDVQAVLLVGGGARTLKVQDAVARIFGRSVNDCLLSECPEELVARGAAVYTYAQQSNS